MIKYKGKVCSRILLHKSFHSTVSMRTSIRKTSSLVFAIKILEDLNYSSSTESHVVQTVFQSDDQENNSDFTRSLLRSSFVMKTAESTERVEDLTITDEGKRVN